MTNKDGKEGLSEKESNLLSFFHHDLTIEELETEGVFIETTYNVSLYKLSPGVKVYRSTLLGDNLYSTGTTTMDIGFTARTNHEGKAQILMSELVAYIRDTSNFYYPPFNVVATSKSRAAILSARGIPQMPTGQGSFHDVKFLINSFDTNGDPMGGVTFDVRAMMALVQGPD